MIPGSRLSHRGGAFTVVVGVRAKAALTRDSCVPRDPVCAVPSTGSPCLKTWLPWARYMKVVSGMPSVCLHSAEGLSFSRTLEQQACFLEISRTPLSLFWLNWVTSHP